MNTKTHTAVDALVSVLTGAFENPGRTDTTSFHIAQQQANKRVSEVIKSVAPALPKHWQN